MSNVAPGHDNEGGPPSVFAPEASGDINEMTATIDVLRQLVAEWEDRLADRVRRGPLSHDEAWNLYWNEQASVDDIAAGLGVRPLDVSGLVGPCYVSRCRVCGGDAPVPNRSTRPDRLRCPECIANHRQTRTR